MDYYQLSNNNRNATASPTILPLPDDSPCSTEDDFIVTMETRFLLISTGIIICLSLLEKRSNQQVCNCAGGRPGLIYPVNLLDYGCDNFGYAMAFGSVASYCFNLFFNDSSLYSKGPAWSKTLYLMLYVLISGLLFYPLFACLTTTWVFVGSIFGLAYTGLWLFYTAKPVIQCPNGPEGTFIGLNVVLQIPVLFCLLCLFIRYGYILIKHVIHIIKERRVDDVIRQYEREHLGTKFNVQYVKELLIPTCPTGHHNSMNQEVEPTIRTRLRVFLRRCIYLNDPTFKYSPKIICIFVVALICAYKFGIGIILGSYVLKEFAQGIIQGSNATSTDNEKFLITLIKVFNGSMVFSFCISSLLTIFAIFQILTNYRENLKRMYKGDFTHLPFRRYDRHPQFILSDSMSYAGSQIAHILWGYIIVTAVLVITCMVLMYLIVLPVFNVISRDILKIVWNILPGFVILQALLILQKLFSRFLLQTRTSIDEKGRDKTTVVLALNNRKVYHNVSYFLFFFYIVLGVFGCFITIAKGVIVGILYLARLDKCGLIAGFETWDRGHMYYVSFLHVEECHRHPVLLVFCDMLIDSIRSSTDHKRELQNYGSVPDTHPLPVNGNFQASETNTHISVTKRLIRNRWLKAYTMIRNHGLCARDIEEEYSKIDEQEINFAKNYFNNHNAETV